jgi:hypothetical protein
MKPATATPRRPRPDFAAMLRDPCREARHRARPINSVQVVDAVSGALMLLPRALFARIGASTKVMLSAEDLDLCRRARDAGASRLRQRRARGARARRVLAFAPAVRRGQASTVASGVTSANSEAPRRNALVRIAVFAMIWARFPFALARRLRDR